MNINNIGENVAFDPGHVFTCVVSNVSSDLMFG